MRAIRETLSERVEDGRMRREDLNRAMARVTPTLDWTGFGRADVVIEAVFEDLDLKRDMLAKVQEHGHDRADEADEDVYEILGGEPDDHDRDEEIAERCILQMVNEAAR